jgi:hypothetical protein
MKQMRSITICAAVALCAAMLCCNVASAQPASVPRNGTAPHDCARTFNIIKNYFYGVPMNMFHVSKADAKSGTLVAHRSDIGSADWNNWAYCKLGPKQMLDTLRNGAATVTVTTRLSRAKSCFVSVKAEFEGTYGLGANSTTTRCFSKGVLENQILRAAGVPGAGS